MRSPTTRSGGSSFAERKSTGTSELRRSCRQRLMPSTAGMRTSSVTRSGRNSLNVSIAWRASVIALTSCPASSRTVLTSRATSRSSSTTRIRPPRASRREAGAVSCSSICNETAKAVPFLKTSACSGGKGVTRLAERCIDPDELFGDPRTLGPDVLGPGSEEESIGLVLDLLPDSRACSGGLESGRLDEAILAQPLHRRGHILGPLVCKQISERGVVGRFIAPQAREDLDLGSGPPRRAPRRHVAVVADLPEAVDGCVELRERTGRRIVAAVTEREGRVLAPGGLRRLRGGEERAIENARELRELVLRQGRERRVVRTRRLVHRGGESSTLLGQVPAAVTLFGEAGAARGRGHRKPASGARAVRACEIARFRSRTAVAAIGQVDRPDECGSIDPQLVRLLERERHLRPPLVEKERKERRDLGWVRRPHPAIVPKVLARRALLLSLRVLDAERRLRHELEPLRRYLSSADHALAVFAALETPERLVDQAEPSLEHGLSRQVELPCFSLARGVSRGLVGGGDVPTALELRHREAFPDPFDRRREIGMLALESLAHRIGVHIASVRQNWSVVPQDVSKRRSEPHLLDVREQDQWDAGHIEGAQHIPL